ncbi:MAG: hypothetical protein HYY35_03970 [Deltaproteobacteria bacterium]|nr:hypothetical protein [Deltaproteobacteria bacterium]
MSARPHGIALVSVLFLLVAVLVLTATLFFSVFIDLQSTSNVSAGDDALYVAEAGIQHLWSLLEPAPDFRRELDWPGGEPPFGSPVWFPDPPRTYRVRLSALPDGRLTAVSEGTSRRGARRRVQALFHREAEFRPRAALVAGEGTVADDLSGTVELAVVPPAGDVTGVGAERRRDAQALRGALRDDVRIATVGPSGLRDAADRLRGTEDATLSGPITGGSWGAAGSPVLVRLAGQGDVIGAATITGALLADAPLRVFGRLEIEGLLLAPYGIEVGGELVIRGAGFVAGPLTVRSAGALAVSYATSALDGADRACRGGLPRAPILGAWKEVW